MDISGILMSQSMLHCNHLGYLFYKVFTGSLSFVSWTEYICKDSRWVLTDPPLFLFPSLFSHSSSLFYFRTDEASEQHLKLICLSSLIPDLRFLCSCSYLSAHARCLTHTSTLP